MANANTENEMLTRQQVSEWLQIKEHTLRSWATSGKGPKFVKVGRCVRYRRSDVDAWLAGREKCQPVSLV